ncbi:hypothetical protein HZH68_011146 [Vespula germanica]|uniref:Uncharacterized protein n=1 Tax=Vespula germanica TaxID=30212 RepID=A0A834JMJ4_VESGE|nr:hypothetical protein HZH68_011146 [Vespula germanica]
MTYAARVDVQVYDVVISTVPEFGVQSALMIRNDNEDSRVEVEVEEEEEEEEEEVEEEIEKEEDGAVDREPLENTSKVLGSAIDQLRTNAGNIVYEVHFAWTHNTENDNFILG